MILKSIALINLSVFGLCFLAQSYHFLPAPDIGPAIAYCIVTVFLLTLSGLLTWHRVKPSPYEDLRKMRSKL